MSDYGQEHIGRGKPPISSGRPTAPPVGGSAERDALEVVAEAAAAARDVAIALGLKATVSQRFKPVVTALLAAGASAVVTYAVMKRRRP